MAWEGNRNGKRIRSEDEEVYLDNYHANKRYLTEVISSSLNGLRVGEPVGEPPVATANLPGDITTTADSSSPCRTVETCTKSRSHTDDPTLDSPMSDDSEESVSYRRIRSYSMSCEPETATTTIVSSNQKRSFSRCYHYHHQQQQQQDTDGRYPSSPSDSCQQPDLRRAALMRSLQIRALSLSFPDIDKPAAASVTDATAEDDVDENLEMNGEVTTASPLHHHLSQSSSVRCSSSVRSLRLDGTSTVKAAAAAADELLNVSSIQKRSRGNATEYTLKSKLKRTKEYTEL